MKPKIKISFIILFLFSIVLAGCSSKKAEGTEEVSKEDPLKLIVAHTGTKGNSVYVFFEKLKEEIETRSNGSIKLEIHDSGVLGGDNQIVESVKIGSVDIVSAASSNMATFTDTLTVLDLPYLFSSRESANNVLNGEIGEQLLKETSEAAGTHAMTFIDVGGFRLLANTKKEVKVPEDVKGLKLRATASPIEIALIEELGANPAPIAWGETYNSLEQKVVDGLQLQPNWLALNGFGEIIKYATKTQGLMAFHLVQFNQQKWESLTDEQRQIINDSIITTRDTANKADAEDEEKFISDLEELDVKVYTPTEDELSSWKELGSKVREKLSTNSGIDQKLVEQIIQAQ